MYGYDERLMRRSMERDGYTRDEIEDRLTDAADRERKRRIDADLDERVVSLAEVFADQVKPDSEDMY